MKIHIPTTQYGFIEAEVENVLEAKLLHDEIELSFKSTNGIPEKEFNNALDEYLNKGTGITDTYLRMSNEQKGVFQHLKKHFKRMGAIE